MKTFTQWNTFNTDTIKFALGQERNGKMGVNMFIDDKDEPQESHGPTAP